MTRTEMTDALTIAMTCHLPTRDCQTCRKLVGDVLYALKRGDPEQEADREPASVPPEAS